MLNIHEHIFDDLTQDEFWLIVQLARFGQNIFPSNDLILKRCGWGFTKLKAVKRSLVKRQFITVKRRFKIDDSGKSVRDSNEYVLKLDTVTQYAGATQNDKHKRELTKALEDAQNEIKELNEKIDQLKKRVAELEAAQTKPAKQPKKKTYKRKLKTPLEKHGAKCKDSYKVIKDDVILFEGLNFDEYDTPLKFILFNWLKYKMTLPKYYTTKKGMQRAVNVVRKIKNVHGVDIAEASVLYSIENEWQGIYLDKILIELEKDKDFKNRFKKDTPRVLKIG